jgi:hypothetical protein
VTRSLKPCASSAGTTASAPAIAVPGVVGLIMDGETPAQVIRA